MIKNNNDVEWILIEDKLKKEWKINACKEKKENKKDKKTNII